MPTPERSANKSTSRVLSTLLGLAVAAVFLVLTFRDSGQFTGHLLAVSPWQMALMALVCLVALLLRGLRWWYLLPRPLRKGELVAVQRALALSYGVNNVASRVGEVVRILVLRRDTGRDFATVTSTLVADRILFDLTAFGLLTALALQLFREPLMAQFPDLALAFPLFVLATLVAVAGLAWLALHPGSLLRLMRMLGLARLGGLWTRLVQLTGQLNRGLQMVTKPRELASLSLINLGVWGLSFVHFLLSLAALDIAISPMAALPLFAIASLGFVLPSPGGLGTFHYFMTFALTRFAAVDETRAIAAATVCHGVNYLVLSLAAVVALFVKPKLKMEEP